jgi:hypothetical protein
MRIQTIGLIILAAGVFGCLMAFQYELDNRWARALVAAIAAVGFAGATRLILARDAKRNQH